jgi:hypothetical protein
MNRDSLLLFKRLLELAELQRKAVREQRFDDAAEIQIKRDAVFDKIQNIGINAFSSVSDSQQFDKIAAKEIIESLFSIDNEIKTLIQAEMKSLSEKLRVIQKIQGAMADPVEYKKAGKNLNISA